MALIGVILNNDCSQVKSLLLSGYGVTRCDDDDGITPMHYAAQIGSRDMMALLIMFGSDVYMPSHDGEYTPYSIDQTRLLLVKARGKMAVQAKPVLRIFIVSRYSRSNNNKPYSILNIQYVRPLTSLN